MYNINKNICNKRIKEVKTMIIIKRIVNNYNNYKLIKLKVKNNIVIDIKNIY